MAKKTIKVEFDWESVNLALLHLGYQVPKQEVQEYLELIIRDAEYDIAEAGGDIIYGLVRQEIKRFPPSVKRFST